MFLGGFNIFLFNKWWQLLFLAVGWEFSIRTLWWASASASFTTTLMLLLFVFIPDCFNLPFHFFANWFVYFTTCNHFFNCFLFMHLLLFFLLKLFFCLFLFWFFNFRLFRLFFIALFCWLNCSFLALFSQHIFDLINLFEILYQQ